MKIIKQGVVPDTTNRLYRGTCPKCNGVIEVNESEIARRRLTTRYTKGCPTPNCNWHTIIVDRYEPETVTWRTTSGARVKGVIV